MQENNKRRRRRARGTSTSRERPGSAKVIAMPVTKPCWECNAETTIERWFDIDPSPLFPPPLWIVDNEWLIQYGTLCVNCIEAGERINLCYERGGPHNFWAFGGGDPSSGTCLDCGQNDDRNIKPTLGQLQNLTRARFEATIAAREAEIVVLAKRMKKLSGPPRSATASRLVRLREDLAWCTRALNEMPPWPNEENQYAIQ